MAPTVRPVLSDDSDDGASAKVLTPAEKSRRTRAKNQAKQEAQATALAAETAASGGRQSKKDALKTRVWDTSADANLKRAASTTDQVPPRAAKKSKSAGSQDVSDPKPNKPTKRDTRKKVQDPLVPSKAKSKLSALLAKSNAEDEMGVQTKTTTTRRFLPKSTRIVLDSDDDNSEPEPASAKPSRKSSAGNPSMKVIGADSTDGAEADGNDSVLSVSDRDSDAGNDDNISASDDGLKGDSLQINARLLSERPCIIKQVIPAAPDIEDEVKSEEYDPADLPSLYSHHRRMSSSSSRGASEYEIPVDTDFDDMDIDNEEPPAKKHSAAEPKLKKPSAQQMKYEEEKPQIQASIIDVRSNAKAKPPKTVIPETAWPAVARVVYPSNGGGVKLTDQNTTMRQVIKGAFRIALFDLAITNGYPATTSRAASVQPILRAAAKEIGSSADDIGKRAKRDLGFCHVMASLIFARTSRHRNEIKNAVISKVAVHYELQKDGITPSQVRFKVKRLLNNQQYIFAYNRDNPFPTGQIIAAVPDAGMADDTNVATDDLAASTKYFKTNGPYLAPAIADITHQIWFATAKGLGHMHADDLVSHRADRPAEKELSDPMMGLVCSNIEVALMAWMTGRHGTDVEFSQSRLEGIYRVHIDTITAQRTDSSKGFHKIMHDLYRRASQLQCDFKGTSVSANTVIRLDIDEDSE
ncbi:hypothetical protein C8J57DRAFT_1717076 [Mycena rebaudengoi]|nr:hypothetical protein C8J57DRAFT_1717076 [Mycena rebaudengoi]